MQAAHRLVRRSVSNQLAWQPENTVCTLIQCCHPLLDRYGTASAAAAKPAMKVKTSMPSDEEAEKEELIAALPPGSKLYSECAARAAVVPRWAKIPACCYWFTCHLQQARPMHADNAAGDGQLVGCHCSALPATAAAAAAAAADDDDDVGSRLLHVRSLCTGTASGPPMFAGAGVQPGSFAKSPV